MSPPGPYGKRKRESAGVSRLVMKFGGTSVADLERIRRVGRLVAAEVATGKQVAVVVSAMSGKTNELVAWTDGDGKAHIDEIPSANLEAAFAEGEIAVIAGFQGVTRSGRIATLGRGGSDTSAVAVAAALQAVRCDIYTDVDGGYTHDPRIEEKARRLARISYEEMLEMASQG